jgi:hypothetical protein
MSYPMTALIHRTERERVACAVGISLTSCLRERELLFCVQLVGEGWWFVVWLLVDAAAACLHFSRLFGSVWLLLCVCV